MDGIAFVDNQAAMLRQRPDSSPFSRLSWWSNMPECDIKGSNSCETVDETTVGLIVRRSVASLSLEWAGEVEKSTVDIPQSITVSARIRTSQCRAQRLEKDIRMCMALCKVSPVGTLVHGDLCRSR